MPKTWFVAIEMTSRVAPSQLAGPSPWTAFLGEGTCGRRTCDASGRKVTSKQPRLALDMGGAEDRTNHMDMAAIIMMGLPGKVRNPP